MPNKAPTHEGGHGPLAASNAYVSGSNAAGKRPGRMSNPPRDESREMPAAQPFQSGGWSRKPHSR